MKNIIEHIAAAFHFDKANNIQNKDQQVIECNYANNYYGDQQCQLKSAKSNDN